MSQNLSRIFYGAGAEAFDGPLLLPQVVAVYTIRYTLTPIPSSRLRVIPERPWPLSRQGPSVPCSIFCTECALAFLAPSPA